MPPEAHWPAQDRRTGEMGLTGASHDRFEERPIPAGFPIALPNEDSQQHAIFGLLHRPYSRRETLCRRRQHTPSGPLHSGALTAGPVEHHVRPFKGDDTLAKLRFDTCQEQLNPGRLVDHFDDYRQFLRDRPGALLENRTVRSQTIHALQDGGALESVAMRPFDNPFVQRLHAVADEVRQLKPTEHLLRFDFHVAVSLTAARYARR